MDNKEITLVNGLHIEYYDDGRKRCEENFKNGERDGPRIKYCCLDGKIEEKENYEKGKLHGQQTQYHFNGNIWTIVNYKKGKLDGVYITFNEDSSMRDSSMWKDGKRID